MTHLDNLTVIEIDGKKANRYKHWGGALPKFAKHLRICGEAGVVKLKTVSTGKLENKGTVCAFVGYSPTHAGDCYQMWDPIKKSIHITRDIRWLKQMYYKANYDAYKEEDDLQFVLNSRTFKDRKGKNDAVSWKSNMVTIAESDSDEESTEDEVESESDKDDNNDIELADYEAEESADEEESDSESDTTNENENEMNNDNDGGEW